MPEEMQDPSQLKWPKWAYRIERTGWPDGSGTGWSLMINQNMFDARRGVPITGWLTCRRLKELHALAMSIEAFQATMVAGTLAVEAAAARHGIQVQEHH